MWDNHGNQGIAFAPQYEGVLELLVPRQTLAIKVIDNSAVFFSYFGLLCTTVGFLWLLLVVFQKESLKKQQELRVYHTIFKTVTLCISFT